MSRVNQYGPAVTAATGISRSAQILDILSLRRAGFAIDEYYVLELYRPDHRHFMSLGEYDRIQSRFNPKVVGVVEFNKWIFGRYADSVGLPTPACHGVLNPDTGFLATGAPLRDRDGLRALLAKLDRPIAIKPCSGGQGRDVFVVDRFDSGSGLITRASGAVQPFDEFWSNLENPSVEWLIQDKVVQHPTLARLHPTSVNTIRVITWRNNGQSRILGAILKVGGGDSEVDNTLLSGGCFCNVDVESGTLGRSRQFYRAHESSTIPGTDFVIEGIELPHWQQFRRTVLRAHDLLPFAGSFGWDVAIGEDGPVIIECNSHWYHNHIQRAQNCSLWDMEITKGMTRPDRLKG